MKELTSPSSASPDLRVQGLLNEMGALEIPFYLEQAIRSNLDVVVEINGTNDPTQVMFKTILFGQASLAVMHFRSMREMQKAHLEGCPVNQMVRRSQDGTYVMPWKDDLRVIVESINALEKAQKEAQAAPEEAKDSPPEESSVTLGWRANDILKFKGPVAKLIGSALACVIFFGGIILAVKLTKDQVAKAVSVAIQKADAADMQEGKE